jgi:crotonobetainyl-CoA:carnitine CoA-transferase CaiB-like acyl-CoA transferase
MWEDMAGELGMAHLTADTRFKTNADRYSNRAELWPLLDAAFLQQSSAHWVERFRARAIPVGLVNTLDKALSDPHVLHRNMVLDLGGNGQAVRVAGNPVKFVGEQEPAPEYPPRVGADTGNVLSRVLGWSQERVAALAKQGVLLDSAAAARDLP